MNGAENRHGAIPVESPPSWLLDWRFLLPTPALGQTLVLGEPPRARRSMLAALEGATPVTRAPAAPGSVDGALLFGIGARDLEAARLAVRPGGWLYAEVGPIARRTSTMAGLLRRAGFVGTRMHWHSPSFSECREMVPLDRSASVRASLERRRGRGPTAVLYRAAIALERIGLFEALAPTVSVVAIRRSEL